MRPARSPWPLTVTVGGVAAWLVLTAALTAAFGPSAAALALAVTALTGGAFVLGRAVGREDASVELGDWPAPVAAQIGGDQ